GLSHMFITGPEVIKTVTHEEVTFDELGGAMVCASKKGVAQFVAKSEDDCFQMVRKLMSFLPSSCLERPPIAKVGDDPNRTDEDLRYIVPMTSSKWYDVLDVIRRVVDDGDFLEVHAQFAKNLITGFARFDGKTVGIIANQPKYLAGVLDVDASRKGARFIRFCDAFNIPIIMVHDIPGFMPGTEQEFRGIIIHGAKMLYAFSEATVPKIVLILRKSYGGGYGAMGNRHMGADIVLAWATTAEIAVMGAEGAANIIFRREIAEAEDPEKKRMEKTEEYREKLYNPYQAAARGYVDVVIDPKDTRPRLIDALEMLSNKRVEGLPTKKHGNVPL
ncbi:MAG: methylmalonyl-CoA carboxyltransferase, partial [Nitrososphaeria archaeon]|nr:methylmalonyl-CoA carboxyltransferase [Nitrososphaeria archaeon]